MTRRTDWAEYAYPDASEDRGDGVRGGPTGGDSAYGDTGPNGGGPGVHEDDGVYEGDGGPAAGARRGRGAPGDGRRRGDGSPGGGRRRGGGDPSGESSPFGEGGSRGEGARGGRGRRRQRGFGEPGGDPQDGGSASSSRAERAEPPADPAERARAICLRLLTGMPRTRKQLADALRKREIPDEVAEEVLSRFEEVGLINDSAFADAWVESRHHGRGLARRALVQELRTKGVDSTLIDEAVGQLDSEQEETTARELVARKLRVTRGLDRDKRLRRLAGMLARKGYPQGMALRVVRQALDEEGDEGDDAEFLGDDEY
ncbi:recombination regulator RecX [Streptomyces turgidiscabies]|uniref:Regulatory protein RecX n=1 Tax=Streptomyces turgidiscabies (strain Car8) TaxID=698760 RepID=L7F2L5_STRT8|nr:MULTISPECIES: recombination regulator RecX [Streptomyces]ELP65226.1 regulatory protein RecX [Streptomyces turgidiscabies Car8]MDX3498617.1 recombination regulator RecX [Streptomyces turgidiscabies]GAQ73587.1 regulatory protein RecX [Streptomyces turgidiscabies]